VLIDTTNAERINSKDVHLHDDLFLSFRFIRDSCEAVILCSDYKHIYEISFHDVIGVEMTSCDFWGPGPNVDCFYYISEKERILIPKLQEEYEKYAEPDDLPFDNASYIETVLSLISGDRIRIACKTVQIGK
jgi:hypothetical protein